MPHPKAIAQLDEPTLADALCELLGLHNRKAFTHKPGCTAEALGSL